MAKPNPAHSRSPRKAIGVAVGCVFAAIIGAGAAVAFVQGQPDPVMTGSAGPGVPSSTPSDTANSTAAPPAIHSPVPIPTVTFSLIAAGDVLPHQPVLASASDGNGYNFAPQFKPTKKLVSGADIALCHMEVPVAPKGTKPSGYPTFGAPASLVKDLAKAGWDGCSTASNHSVDRGFAGIESTLNAFQAADMGHAGTARSKDESTQVQYYNVLEDGRIISVAHISYTYGLNGLPKPEGKPWSVNVFDADAADVTPILDEAQAARDDGADVVVVSVHCCVEYNTEPTPTQKSIVAQIAESGLVDLYIGHHAHVPQPIRKIDGGPDGDGMWAAYGLGNFISNQDGSTVGVAESANGLMLRATFTVSPDDDVSVDVGWTAVTVDRLGGHVVYPISEDSGSVGNLSAGTVKQRWQLVADAAGDEAPEITKPDSPRATYVGHTTRTP